MSSKQDIKSIDFIVISIMNKQTGDYSNKLVTNHPRWKTDTKNISNDDIVRIEIFKLGTVDPMLIYYSLEEFEDAINL